ncbi:type II secretion system F family protein [Candidatus Berkelbacteria bacterium]|nr:type II secretion system F family protein [Candidatus Berkelbacteria bacterium]
MDLSQLPFLNRISGRDRAFFARQLATMLASGLPINKAVGILAAQAKQERLKAILVSIESDLETGASFSQAASKHPEMFDRVFTSVILAGEQVGRLAEVLSQLAGQLERDVSFTSRVRGALSYPLFVVGAMGIVGAIMIVTIVPQLEDIFREAGADLPWTTTVILTFSKLLKSYWWAGILLALGGIALLVTYLRSKAGERILGQVMIHLPESLGYDIYMARLTRTLGMLVQSGTPIIEAITVTSAVVDNVYYHDLLIEAAEQVKRGVPLSVPLGRSALVPPIVSQMISVGEQTGRLDQILLNLAEYYEEEAGEKLKQISSLIEPLVIVIVGIGVGFLVYSILVPIYNIAQLQ